MIKSLKQFRNAPVNNSIKHKDPAAMENPVDHNLESKYVRDRPQD
jgi:hypothetical protein